MELNLNKILQHHKSLRRDEMLILINSLNDEDFDFNERFYVEDVKLNEVLVKHKIESLLYSVDVYIASEKPSGMHHIMLEESNIFVEKYVAEEVEKALFRANIMAKENNETFIYKGISYGVGCVVDISLSTIYTNKFYCRIDGKIHF